MRLLGWFLCTVLLLAASAADAQAWRVGKTTSDTAIIGQRVSRNGVAYYPFTAATDSAVLKVQCSSVTATHKIVSNADKSTVQLRKCTALDTSCATCTPLCADVDSGGIDCDLPMTGDTGSDEDGVGGAVNNSLYWDFGPVQYICVDVQDVTSLVTTNFVMIECGGN